MAKSSGDSLRRRRQGDGRGKVGVIALRVGVWAIAVVAAILLTLGVCFGLRKIFFTANPHFLMQTLAIRIETGPLDAERVRQQLEALGVREGATNIYAVDQQQLRGKLEALDLVRRVETRLIRPDTLELTVYGRQPTAYLLSANGLLVDDEGVVMPPAARPADVALPVITGIPDAGELKPGDAIEEQLLLAAVHFLSMVAAQPGANALDVKLVQLVPGNDKFRVYLHGKPAAYIHDNTVIVIPAGDMAAALDRVVAILADRAAKQQWTGRIDATYSRVPVEP